MPSRKTAPNPSEVADRVEPPPSTLALVDRAGHAQLRLIVREVRQRNGHLVALKSGAAKVRLSHRKKEFAFWGGNADDPPTVVITADGYRALNTVAQITVLTPPSLEVPGVGKVANPYVRLAPGTEAFQAGWVRKLAIAPGPTGNLTIADRTTYLSLVEYLLEDLIGVSKKNPTAVLWGSRAVSPANDLAEAIEQHNADKQALAKKERKEWPLKYLISDEEKDRAIASAKRPDRWAFYPVEPVTGQGLWYDRRAEAVVRVFATYAQSGKFGVRKLEAICYRNVLRDHPLMPSMQLSWADVHPVYREDVAEQAVDLEAQKKEIPAGWTVDNVVEVPVFFHEQEADEERVREVVQEFERGLRTAAYVEIDPERAREPERARRDDAATTAVDEPEEKERRGNDFFDDDQPDDREVQDAPRGGVPGRTAPVADPQAELIAQIRGAEEILGADALPAILKKHPAMADRRKATREQLGAYLRALTNQINARAARD